jgi:DNA-binding LacI/PurR family transcriptional regulator
MPLPILHPKLPKYAQLAEQIKAQISSGQLKAGDRLPSFVEMRALHGVSQSIMERAYALLEEDYLIERQPGLGTFVSQQVKYPRTGILGLIMHANSYDMSTPYTLHWLTGVKQEAERHDLQIYWLNEQDERTINRKNMDAVLLVCHSTEALALGLPPDMPQVLLFQHSADFTCVKIDDFNAMKLATEHLLSLGHRHISYLASNKIDSISEQRVAGYKSALKEAKIVSNDDLLKFLEDPRSLGFCKSGEVTMKNWLKEGWFQLESTAIMVHNDDCAIGVIKALTNHGLHVPEDVSVVGFDGTEFSDFCSPSLTTIKVPLEEIGERAVKVLLQQIEGGVIESEQNVLPVQLKLGESTASFKSSAKLSYLKI